MKSSAPFRTFPHFSAPTPHTHNRTLNRSAAPLPYGVRGCGAEGLRRGGSFNSFRTRTAPDGESQ